MTATILLYGETDPRTLPDSFDLDALVKALSLGRYTDRFEIHKSPRRSWRFTAGDVVQIRATGVDYSDLDAPKTWTPQAVAA